MKPIDVDPLDEQRWKSVEMGVFRALDADAESVAEAPRARPVRSWGLGLAGAALAAGLSLLGYVALREARPERSAVTAAPPVDAAGASERLLSRDQPLERRWGQVALRAAPHSQVTLDAPRGSLHRGRLEAGELRVEVPPNEQLELTVGRVLVRASAVRFVASYAGFRPQLQVEDGALQLTGEGAPPVLRAGERWLPSEAAGPSKEDAQLTVAVPGSAPALSPRARYEEAARLEGTDPGRAERLYTALARGRGPWSAHALFALGRLELERGQATRGRATLRRYLARYPGGPNAEDARRLLAPRP